jgi:hypothetical protein
MKIVVFVSQLFIIYVSWVPEARLADVNDEAALLACFLSGSVRSSVRGVKIDFCSR